MSGQNIREMEGSSWDFRRRVCTGGEGREGRVWPGSRGRLCRLGEFVLPEGTPTGEQWEETLEKQGWCRQTAGCGVDLILETAATTRHQCADLGAWKTGQGAGTRSADWDGVSAARMRWGGWECSLGVSGRHRCPRRPVCS